MTTRRTTAGEGNEGRKRSKVEPHGPRDVVSPRHPAHVTLKLARDLPSLRRDATFEVLRECFSLAKDRLVHFSVQDDHIHLIAEAPRRRALSSAIQGLKIRLAKQLNRVWGRGGTIFPERYHLEVLRTPSEVRDALRCVFGCARRTGARLEDELDPMSSAAWFPGWKGRRGAAEPLDDDAPVAAPRTKLLTEGWKEAGGAIEVTEVPAEECR